VERHLRFHVERNGAILVSFDPMILEAIIIIQMRFAPKMLEFETWLDCQLEAEFRLLVGHIFRPMLQVDSSVDVNLLVVFLVAPRFRKVLRLDDILHFSRAKVAIPAAQRIFGVVVSQLESGLNFKSLIFLSFKST